MKSPPSAWRKLWDILRMNLKIEDLPMATSSELYQLSWVIDGQSWRVSFALLRHIVEV